MGNQERAWPLEECAQHLRELAALGRLDADCVDVLLVDPEQLGVIQRQFADPDEHAAPA